MARHEAREQIRKVADELAVSVLPSALDEIAGRLGFLRPSADKHELLFNAFNDEATILACEIDGAGELIFPPRSDLRFAHAPLDFSKLTSDQLMLWEQATAAGLLRR